MRVTYPGMREIDQRLWDRPTAAMDAARFAAALGGLVLLTTEPGPGPTFGAFRAAHRVVWRGLDRETVWVAPWWLAWLYRLLPYHVSWNNGPDHQQARPAFYLWHVLAPTWRVAWLPAGRSPDYGARWGVLRYGRSSDRMLCL